MLQGQQRLCPLQVQHSQGEVQSKKNILVSLRVELLIISEQVFSSLTKRTMKVQHLWQNVSRAIMM